MGGQRIDMAREPAFGGIVLAVLLALLLGQFRLARGRVLLGPNEGRHPWLDAGMAIVDDGRLEHGMEVLLGLGGADMAG